MNDFDFEYEPICSRCNAELTVDACEARFVGDAVVLSCPTCHDDLAAHVMTPKPPQRTYWYRYGDGPKITQTFGAS